MAALEPFEQFLHRPRGLVRSGLDGGATALVGGTPVTDPALDGGFFVTPTINTYGWFDVAVPYGGFRMSGSGKELGREALDSYLQAKTVWIDLS